MKQKISSTAVGKIIRNWFWRISFAVLICTVQLSAQQGQQTPPEFPLGVYLDKWDSTNQLMYQYVDELGANTIVQYANGPNAVQKDMLDGYNLVAVKHDSEQDAVAHYSNGYYTKWEAEDTTKNELKTGIKADYGYETFYDNTYCWTSGDNINNANSIMLRGPHYRQDKKYRPWYLIDDPLIYILDLQIAVSSVSGINPDSTDPVCKISVVFTYKEGSSTIDSLFMDTTLYVNSFSGEDFQNFSLTYRYDEGFDQYNEKMSGLNQYNLLDYDDTYPGTGIQFVVTWYGNKQLYIDYFQVYDRVIGYEIVNQYTSVVTDIVNFVDNYSAWNNINYYFNVSEPQTIDNYTPMKMVDDILDSLSQVKGIAEFYPQYNGWRNGDRTIFKFKEIADPEKVMMEFITFVDGKPMEEMYECQRSVLQEVSEVNPDFWYESLIAEPTLPDGNNCWLYMPSPEQLNASLMLSLAHGAKGILFWKMAPGEEQVYEANCGDDVWYNVILDKYYSPNEPLYSYLKNNFLARLKGKLGKTLMNLNYTGDFLQLQYSIPTQPQPVSYDYLTLGLGQPADNMNWHCGMFDRPQHPDDKYFMLANLITTQGKSIPVKIQTPGPYPLNYRFRNVEGLFDTTIQAPNYLIKQLDYPPGEGYLYEFAPVIKYGGRLIYDETISDPTILIYEMIIENAAELKINTTYSADRDIRIKAGGRIVTTTGGTIKFYEGSKLIVE